MVDTVVRGKMRLLRDLIFSIAFVLGQEMLRCTKELGRPLDENGYLCQANGSEGRCKPFAKCASAFADIRNRIKPNLCPFGDTDEPEVCCPFSGHPENLRVDGRETCKFLNRTGECRHLSQCPSVQQNILAGVRPSYCCYDYKQREPVICCPFDSDPIDETLSENEPIFEMPVLENEETSQLPSSVQAYFNIALQKCRNYSFYTYTIYETPLVGGEKSLAQEFLHMAALGIGPPEDPQWVCGGSLISENFVLTAAHCLQRNITIVRLGDLDLNSTSDDAKPQDFAVELVIPHPRYTIGELYNDIGLVKLSKPVEFTNYVYPGCLAQGTPPTGTQVVATGWGSTESGGPGSSHLLKVDLSVTDDAECFQKNPPSPKLKDGIQKETQMCAGSSEAKDTCQGDSGGPLQIKISDSILMDIISVTSFGKLCGTPNQPGVYTKVTSYIPWIVQEVWLV